MDAYGKNVAPPVLAPTSGGDNAKILVRNFGGKNFAPNFARKMTNFVFISTKTEKFSLYD